jgi:hypothetical protein
VDGGPAAAYRSGDADARRIHRVEISMLKYLLAAAMSAAIVVAGATVPSVSEAAPGIQVAQATQPKSSDSKSKSSKSSKAAEKKLTPQQQKMKDCAGKWNARPDKSKVKGRDAYRKFMSVCLKG